jgi:hypothetical protein
MLEDLHKSSETAVFLPVLRSVTRWRQRLQTDFNLWAVLSPSYPLFAEV